MYFASSNLKTWLRVCYTSETIGADHARRRLYQKKNVLFATVTLHNNIFCHWLSEHLHCTNRPFTYVLRKDTLSRRSKCRRHRLQRMFSTNYHAKATRTVLLDWSFAMGALQ